MERSVTLPVGGDTYHATRFDYSMNRQAVAYIVGETWDADEVSCPTGYNIDRVYEFHYDSGRQRYLKRELDPEAMMDDPWR